jgi:pimeloyl-ACP methyl ester carboxylesterase
MVRAEGGHLRKGYVDTDFGQVHYYADGAEGPPLFLFHETALSANEFEKTLPHFARHCRAIALDTPGYGMSDPPPAPLTMGEIAERMVAAIDSFGSGPCALVGAHTGASIALELAANWMPERTTHLVLSGMSLHSETENAAFRKIIGQPVIKRDGSHLIEGWNKRVKRWAEANNDDLEMLHWGMIEQLRVYKRFHWAFEATFAHDNKSAMKKLTCPTYFLIGERDSLVANEEIWAELVPQAERKIVAGAGGRLPYAEPELYAREVLGFLGLPVD